MGTHVRLLSGEVDESTDGQSGPNRDVERILAGFLRSLLDEIRDSEPVGGEAAADRIPSPRASRNEVPFP